MYGYKELKSLDKKTNNTYLEFLKDTNNKVLTRRLAYEIGFLQNEIALRLDDNKIPEDEYDILLDMSFKWNSIINLRRLPKDILYFPENQKILRRNTRKVIYGTVVSNKMNKTSVIQVSKKFKHKIYKKFITKSKKYKIHDENNELNIGDYVSAMECRPLSKEKKFRLLKIIERAK